MSDADVPELPASARAMRRLETWIAGWPEPAELVGPPARWLPAVIYGTTVVLGLLLLAGVGVGERAGRWILGLALGTAWVFRIATLKHDALRRRPGGAAPPLVSWWLAGVAVLGAVWAPMAGLARGLWVVTIPAFLFVIHGKYVLAREAR